MRLMKIIMTSVFTWGTGGYNPMTEVTVDRRSNQVEIFNYATGGYQTIDVEPQSGGGYTGTGFDYQTGRMYDINVDRSGDVEIWNY